MRSSVQHAKQPLLRKLKRQAVAALKVLVKGPLFRDLIGRLTVLLHVLLQLTAFVISIYTLSKNAKWWRSTALADSRGPCRAETITPETVQLCNAFADDLQGLLSGFATAVAGLTLKFCTSAGALCCSEKMATSTRLDKGGWFKPKKSRRAVGRYRHSKITRLELSKPCQWRAAVLACSVWGLCLLCDLLAALAVAWHSFFFNSQITEYADELFPEARDEHSWKDVFLTIGAQGVVLLIDTLMLAAAAFKLRNLDDISDKWKDKVSDEDSNDDTKNGVELT